MAFMANAVRSNWPVLSPPFAHADRPTKVIKVPKKAGAHPVVAKGKRRPTRRFLPASQRRHDGGWRRGRSLS
jgi:hypothetical protein